MVDILATQQVNMGEFGEFGISGEFESQGIGQTSAGLRHGSCDKFLHEQLLPTCVRNVNGCDGSPVSHVTFRPGE